MQKTMKKGEALAAVAGGAVAASLMAGLTLEDILQNVAGQSPEAYNEVVSQAGSALGGAAAPAFGNAETVGETIARHINNGMTWRQLLESVQSADANVFQRLTAQVGTNPLSVLR